MAENDMPKWTDEGFEPPLTVPPHDPLPLPPDISFTQPALGRPSTMHGHLESRRISSGSVVKPDAPAAFNLGTGMSAGITLASSVVVGFLIGQWVDHHWHLSMPWGTIVFSLAGVAAGFINLFRILSAADDGRKK